MGGQTKAGTQHTSSTNSMALRQSLLPTILFIKLVQSSSQTQMGPGEQQPHIISRKVTSDKSRVFA